MPRWCLCPAEYGRGSMPIDIGKDGYWSGFKQEFFGVDPGGSRDMRNSCDTVTNPNPAPLLPGLILGWFLGWFWGENWIFAPVLPQFCPISPLRLIWYKHFGPRSLLPPSPKVVLANFFPRSGCFSKENHPPSSLARKRGGGDNLNLQIKMGWRSMMTVSWTHRRHPGSTPIFFCLNPLHSQHLPANIYGFSGGKKNIKFFSPPPRNKTSHVLICSVNLAFHSIWWPLSQSLPFIGNVLFL